MRDEMVAQTTEAPTSGRRRRRRGDSKRRRDESAAVARHAAARAPTRLDHEHHRLLRLVRPPPRVPVGYARSEMGVSSPVNRPPALGEPSYDHHKADASSYRGI